MFWESLLSSDLALRPDASQGSPSLGSGGMGQPVLLVTSLRDCHWILNHQYRRKRHMKVAPTYVCLRWSAVRLVLTWLYWLYLLLTSLSILAISYVKPGQFFNRSITLSYSHSGFETFRRESMRSPTDLSERYLTLFHENVCRYWSTGSAVDISIQQSCPVVLTDYRWPSSAGRFYPHPPRVSSSGNRPPSPLDPHIYLPILPARPLVVQARPESQF